MLSKDDKKGPFEVLFTTCETKPGYWTKYQYYFGKKEFNIADVGPICTVLQRSLKFSASWEP